MGKTIITITEAIGMQFLDVHTPLGSESLDKESKKKQTFS